MDEFKEEDIESILYIGREVSGARAILRARSAAHLNRTVYKIPPLKANEGHRAQEWGDLAQPLWKGRIRIIERSSGVALQFEDVNTGEHLCRVLRCSTGAYSASSGERMYTLAVSHEQHVTPQVKCSPRPFMIPRSHA